MITKQAFMAALRAIKGPESRWHWEKKELGVTVELDLHQAEYLSSQLALLRAVVPDSHNYIERWLFESLEPISQRDGTTVTVPWDDPGALYDLLVREASALPEEELPLWDLPMVGEFPHRAIRSVDYFNYFDAVLAYVGHHDVVIHIVEEGKEDKLLLGMDLFQRLCALDEAEAKGAAEKIVMEISIDPEAEKAFRELIAPTGFTLEQMAQMFLSWCAYYPEDAATWLKKAAEEQGIAPQKGAEEDD